jgi:hypothetical protein
VEKNQPQRKLKRRKAKVHPRQRGLSSRQTRVRVIKVPKVRLLEKVPVKSSPRKILVDRKRLIKSPMDRKKPRKSPVDRKTLRKRRYMCWTVILIQICTQRQRVRRKNQAKLKTKPAVARRQVNLRHQRVVMRKFDQRKANENDNRSVCFSVSALCGCLGF